MSDAKSEKPAKDKGGKEVKAKKGGSFLGWFMLFAPITLGLGYFYPPLFMVVALMAPGWFALLTDTGEDRALSVCIGSGTLAGAMFSVSGLLMTPPAFPSAMLLLQQPQNWLLPLAGSAAGAVIFYLVPTMVIESVYMRNVAHKKSLEDIQKKLIEDWGPDVRR